MSFFPELDGLTTEELMRWFEAEPSVEAVADEERVLWFQEVARKIAESGDGGLEFLIRHSADADEPRLRAILLSFCFAAKEALQTRREQLREIILPLVHDRRPLVAAEAIDSLSYLGDREAEEDLLPLLHHDSPYVVGSVLRFLSRHDSEKARPALLDALSSLAPIVRQNALDELDELGCVEALPPIRPLLNDEDEDVRQAARTAVRHLEELASPGR